MSNHNSKSSRDAKLAWLSDHRDLWEKHPPPMPVGKERSAWMQKYGTQIVAQMQAAGLISIKTNVYDVNVPRMIFEINEQG
jgi:hypothetical protein